jgi:hypothetical protein
MSRESAIAKTRLVFRDYGEPFRDTFTGNGATKEFVLSADNVDADTLAVTVSGTAQTPGTHFTLEPRSGYITFVTAPAAAAPIVVTGMGGMFSLDADMGMFIDIAFDLHARGRVPALTWETLSPAEEYAIALLAIREALWAEIAEHAHQVDVTTPEGMHIPGGQQFQQLMAMLDRIEAHYREFASVLNVGPFAIRMFTLRRVSRTTNRLVPVYVPQEIDDRNPPVRVYPPIDQGGL